METKLLIPFRVWSPGFQSIIILLLLLLLLCRSVSIELGYGLDDGEIGMQSAGARNLSVPHSIQAGSMTHAVSYPVDTRSSLPGRQNIRSAKLTNHLQPVPRLRMRGVIPLFPNTSSWRGAYTCMSTDITTLLLLLLLLLLLVNLTTLRQLLRIRLYSID
jgi:hypothetical protein